MIGLISRASDRYVALGMESWDEVQEQVEGKRVCGGDYVGHCLVGERVIGRKEVERAKRLV